MDSKIHSEAQGGFNRVDNDTCFIVQRADLVENRGQHDQETSLVSNLTFTYGSSCRKAHHDIRETVDKMEWCEKDTAQW
jgi:hypothetical protein